MRSPETSLVVCCHTGSARGEYLRWGPGDYADCAGARSSHLREPDVLNAAVSTTRRSSSSTVPTRDMDSASDGGVCAGEGVVHAATPYSTPLPFRDIPCRR